MSEAEETAFIRCVERESRATSLGPFGAQSLSVVFQFRVGGLFEKQSTSPIWLGAHGPM